MGVRHPTPPSGRSPPETTDRELRSVFTRAFNDEAAGGPIAIDALRDEVCSYVRRARDRGDPVERVIVALKDLMDLSHPARRRVRSEGTQSLAELVVRWCIEEYYRHPDDLPRPPAPGAPGLTPE